MKIPSISEFNEFLDNIEFKKTFWGVHMERYIQTYAAIERACTFQDRFQHGIEFGTSWVFSTFLHTRCGFDACDVTDFDSDLTTRIRKVKSKFQPDGPDYLSFNLDLESQNLPVADGRYDFAICCELIEHLDVDPMFMLQEFNRVLKVGGVLVVTTPNSTSTQIIERVLHGYAPQFYMYYQKDRSPFRHNFEYSPNQLKDVLFAAGFDIVDFWTKDTFNPPSKLAVDVLTAHNLSTDDRGDNMFAIAMKTSEVRNRYPATIYDTNF